MFLSADIATIENPTEAVESNADSRIGLHPPSVDRVSRMQGLKQDCSLKGSKEVNSSLEGVELASLTPFDTIMVHTANSHYRICLLDPETGRAILEGGHITEPAEGKVFGSSVGNSLPRLGWLGVGFRFEVWVNDQYMRSSPVQSISVQHQSPN